MLLAEAPLHGHDFGHGLRSNPVCRRCGISFSFKLLALLGSLLVGSATWCNGERSTTLAIFSYSHRMVQGNSISDPSDIY